MDDPTKHARERLACARTNAEVWRRRVDQIAETIDQLSEEMTNAGEQLREAETAEKLWLRALAAMDSQHVLKSLAAAWAEGAETALAHAMYNEDTITLRLEKPNPYQQLLEAEGTM